MRGVFLPSHAAGGGVGSRFLWEWACETPHVQTLGGPRGVPRFESQFGATPVISGCWLWRPLWASSQLSPALDSVVGPAHLHLELELGWVDLSARSSTILGRGAALQRAQSWAMRHQSLPGHCPCGRCSPHILLPKSGRGAICKMSSQGQDKMTHESSGLTGG